MDIEVREVYDFLASHAPWSQLSPSALTALVPQTSLRYYRRGSTLYRAGDPNNSVHVVRSGGVDLANAERELVERLGPGGVFGATSVLHREPSRLTVFTIEDTLVLVVPAAAFLDACQNDTFRSFFEHAADLRLRHAVHEFRQSRSGDIALGREIGSLLGRSPVTAPPTVSIRDAATLMSSERVSALLLVEQGQLRGIVTDRDLRSKVVAVGLDTTSSVAQVMTPDPITIGPDARAFEAMLEMTSRGIHHLPVVEQGAVRGLVSAGDLMRLDRAHPIYLAADINRQSDAGGVAAICRRIPQLVAEFVDADASAGEISHLLGSIYDAATRKLITLAQDDLGPAPAPWCWVVMGSQARREAGLGGDQDHAIILANEADQLDPDAHQWWAMLAERVTAGLEEAGYPRCPGDAMATHWCHTARQWRAHFADWLNTPESQDVLFAQIFFDLRPVHGDLSLGQELMSEVTAMAPDSTRFLGHLATQAVAAAPPLGFFKGFVLERGGEHADTLDLKTSTHSIVQIARLHALALGSPLTGTEERLELAAGHDRISREQAAAMIDSLEFINHLRLGHQAREVRQGRRPNNRIDPKTLSPLDQRTLKEAFEVIAKAQKSVQYAHRTHLMS